MQRHLVLYFVTLLYTSLCLANECLPDPKKILAASEPAPSNGLDLTPLERALASGNGADVERFIIRNNLNRRIFEGANELIAGKPGPYYQSLAPEQQEWADQ